MVFIIIGAPESDRNTVGRLLAEALGWEFINAENLRPPANLDHGCSAVANPDATLSIETLSTAINRWIYEWRDVVISCPMLTEGDRRQILKISSLIKIVCLKRSRATSPTHVLYKSVSLVSRLPAGCQGAQDLGPEVMTIDSSRQIEEIIAEMTAVLMM
jgi:gluconate kinase